MFSWIFLQQSSWYTTGWLPQMLYNCGCFDLKIMLKSIPPPFTPRHTPLLCFALFWNMVKWKTPSLAFSVLWVRVYTFLSVEFHFMRTANIFYMLCLFFSFIFLPFWSYAKKLLLNFCLLSTLHLAQTFLSFLFLIFILLSHMWAV